MAYPYMASPLFAPGTPPVDTSPIFDPWWGFGPISIPISPVDPIGGGGLGFGPGLPAPVTPGPVTMPTPIQVPSGHCLLRRRRRINWANPRALSRAGRRLASFNKHARKFIKISRKVKTPKRRRS